MSTSTTTATTATSTTTFLLPLVVTASSLVIVVVLQWHLFKKPVRDRRDYIRILEVKLEERKREEKNDAEVVDGIVSGLFVHPVKSLRAVSLMTAELDPKGFIDDRRFMIVYPLRLPEWKEQWDLSKDTTHRFLSQRQCPSLARVVANIVQEGITTPGDPQTTSTTTTKLVLTYGDKSITAPFSMNPNATTTTTLRASIWDDQVLVEDLGDEAASFFQTIINGDEQATLNPSFQQGIRLVQHAVNDRRETSLDWTPNVAMVPTSSSSSWWSGGLSFWKGTSVPPIVSLTDGFPLLIACEASLEELNRRLQDNNQDPIEMKNFRPNIVIKGTKIPFEEDTWKYIAIGKQIFAVVKPCPRCKQSCTNQDTGIVRVEPVATMKTFRAMNPNNRNDVYFGQNAIALNQSGSINVGDTVYVLERGEPRYES